MVVKSRETAILLVLGGKLFGGALGSKVGDSVTFVINHQFNAFVCGVQISISTCLLRFFSIEIEIESRLEPLSLEDEKQLERKRLCVNLKGRSEN